VRGQPGVLEITIRAGIVKAIYPNPDPNPPNTMTLPLTYPSPHPSTLYPNPSPNLNPNPNPNPYPYPSPNPNACRRGREAAVQVHHGPTQLGRRRCRAVRLRGGRDDRRHRGYGLTRRRGGARVRGALGVRPVDRYGALIMMRRVESPRSGVTRRGGRGQHRCHFGSLYLTILRFHFWCRSLCITSSSRRRHKRPLNEPLCVLVPLVKWATSTSADITGLGSPPYDTWRCRTTVASYDTRRCRTTVVSYDTWRCRTTVVSHDGPEVSYDGSVV